MRIYVAGPYSASTAEARLNNVIRAMQVGRDLVGLGHAPFIPHLTHYFDEWLQSTGETLPYDDYLAWDVEFLSTCDALYFIGASPGADYERAWAEANGIPVFESLQGVLDAEPD